MNGMSKDALFNVECVLLVFARMCVIRLVSVISLASHAVYPDITNNIEEAPASAYSSLPFCAYTATLKMALMHKCYRFQDNFVEA